MISIMSNQDQPQSFLVKYKKWLIALGSLYLIPRILMISAIIAGSIYLYVNNDTNYHPFKSYILSGVREGHADGSKNHVSGQIPSSTLWSDYWWETRNLKEKVALEKEEYLAQFPESERGSKLAEMKLDNIKLPLQLELDKRFKTGLDFYADYVQQRVKRESFATEEEYQKALQDEAWKVGYAHGYREGLAGRDYDTARSLLR
ncbi:MAG: hypothetical protein H6911_05670 [Rickettsiaceae bacterium]|nr:hypothetical protein [Rickettsiaceae bacterium]